MRSPDGSFRIIELGFLDFMFLVCFTTKLKLLNIARTPIQSVLHPQKNQSTSNKNLSFMNTESIPESSLSWQKIWQQICDHVTSDAPWSSARGTFHLTCINEYVLLNRIYFLERSSVFYWTVNFTIKYSICQMGSMVTLINILYSSNLSYQIITIFLFFNAEKWEKTFV